MARRPSWVLVVGILGIVIGLFGILGSTQAILIGTIPVIREVFEKHVEQEAPPPSPDTEEAEGFWDDPYWYPQWSVAVGVAGLPASAFYILASVFLLMMKRYGPKLFYLATATCIAVSVSKIAVALAALSIIGIPFIAGSVLAVICTGLLVIVAAASDKSALRAAADI